MSTTTQTASSRSAAARRQSAPSVAWWGRRSYQRAIGRFFIYLIIIGGAAVVCAPFVWMISTSLKANADVFIFPPQWIPNPPVWSNYPTALTSIPFTSYLWNTVQITFLCLAGTLASNSLVAYAFARLRAPGRDVLFLLVLATIMLPYQVTMIPVFVLFSKLHWVNTFRPLIVPSFFAINAFGIFLLRQFFMTIPVELDDAAKIDGCGVLGIFVRIILPLSRPALATLSIFTFLATWNDYLGPLIYLNDTSKWTLSLGLTNFMGMSGTTQWNYLMVATLATMLPCLVLFFFAQRLFIQGVVVSGVKG
jgi:multiple sugar transport system permease protein